MAVTQIEAYKQGIVEGSFQTYRDGLRPGQLLRVNVASRGIDQTFLVQSVTIEMRGPEQPVYSVDLATTRTVGIIEFLQQQLRARELQGREQETLLRLTEQTEDEFSVADDGVTVQVTEPPYMWMPEDPSDDAAVIAANPDKTPIRWNFFTYES